MTNMFGGTDDETRVLLADAYDLLLTAACHSDDIQRDVLDRLASAIFADPKLRQAYGSRHRTPDEVRAMVRAARDRADHDLEGPITADFRAKAEYARWAAQQPPRPKEDR